MKIIFVFQLIFYLQKNNTLNFPLKSDLLIYWLPFQILTSTAKSSVVIMQR